MKKALWLIGILIFFGSEMYADGTDEWYINLPISNIKVNKLNKVKDKDLAPILSQFIDKPLTQSIVDEIKRRILNLETVENFDLVDIQDGGARNVILFFDIEEKPVINEIEIIGNKSITATQLKSSLKLKSNDIVSNLKIKEGSDTLKKYYLDQGYSNIKIEFATKAVQGKNDVLDVVYTIDEGNQITVNKIDFNFESQEIDPTGKITKTNNANSDFANKDALLITLKTKVASLFEKGTFQEQNLEIDKEKIETYYKKAGFKDVEIVDIIKSFSKDESQSKDLLALTYVIREGRRYEFGSYTFSGNLIFTNEEILKKVKTKPKKEGNAQNKQYTDFIGIEADLEAIKSLYYDQGYAFSRVELVPRIDNSTISYEVRIAEGPLAYIGDIQIKGNVKTKKEIIYRELPMKVGDVFSRSKIRESFQSLMGTGFFSNIVPDIQPLPSGLLQIIFTVAEKSTIDLRVGGTLSGDADFPLAFTGRFADTNFLGEGLNLGTNLTLSSKEQTIGGSYTDNWLFGEDFGGGIGLNISHAQKSTFDEVESTTHPGSPGLGFGGSLIDYENLNLGLNLNVVKTERFPLGKLRLELGLGSELNYIDFDPSIGIPSDSKIVSNNKKFDLINSLNIGLGFDARDLFYDPSSGFYINQKFNMFGGVLGGNRDYIKSTSTLQAWIPLWNIEEIGLKTSIGFNSTLTLLLPQIMSYSGNTFSADDRLLFINSMSEARGWTNWSTVLNLPTGGEGIWNNWVELRTPLVEHTLSLDFFFDAVRIVPKREDIFSAGSSGWLFSMGGGLRLALQQLPLRFYLGKRFLVDGAGEVKWQHGGIFSSSANSDDGIDFILAIQLN